MSLPIVVSPEAEEDLDHARTWYEGQRPGLGDDFLIRAEQVLDLIQRMPSLHAQVFQELRLALVRRFPYAVAYRIDDDQITIVAVYHTRRDPRGWQRRV